MNRELQEFGFRPLTPTRGYQVPLLRGGKESVRRAKVMLAVLGAAFGTALILTVACGGSAAPACVWAGPLTLAGAALMVGLLAAQFWWMAAVPPEFENPRHPAVAGQLASGQSTYPSRDVVFDPEFARKPPS